MEHKDRPQASMSEYRRMGFQAPHMLIERIQTLENEAKESALRTGEYQAGVIVSADVIAKYQARNASLQHSLSVFEGTCNLLRHELNTLKGEYAQRKAMEHKDKARVSDSEYYAVGHQNPLILSERMRGLEREVKVTKALALESIKIIKELKEELKAKE